MHQKQNKNLVSVAGGLNSLFDALASARRLSSTDKPIFAKNLGEMAQRLSPNDPLDGARRIVIKSGNESLWPTKRRKYFRFPGEEAQSAQIDGFYASNPSQFRKLAESAGELLCNSSKPDTVEQWRRDAVKKLAEGSSFMPSFIPSGVAGQSAVDLLDEYAAVLSEAVKNRTRITELWDVMEHTPISITMDPDEIAPYGNAAVFPSELLNPLYNGLSTRAFFSSKREISGSGAWSRPSLNIGSIQIGSNIRIFCIPPEKRCLFKGVPIVDQNLSKPALDWLISEGFDLDQARFPSTGLNPDPARWRDARITFLPNVSLGITNCRPFGSGEPVVQLEALDRYSYAAFLNNESGPSLEDNIFKMVQNPKLTQHWCFGTGEAFSDLEIIYNKPFVLGEPTDAEAIGFIPADGLLYERSQEWECPSCWIAQDPRERFWLSDSVSGWTEDEFIANILLGGDFGFRPIIQDSEPRGPTGGLLRRDSVGASLLHNVRFASDENSISKLLIDRVALTAEAGLRFYEAMFNDFRSAIHKI